MIGSLLQLWTCGFGPEVDNSKRPVDSSTILKGDIEMTIQGSKFHDGKIVKTSGETAGKRTSFAPVMARALIPVICFLLAGGAAAEISEPVVKTLALEADPLEKSVPTQFVRYQWMQCKKPILATQARLWAWRRLLKSFGTTI